MSSTRATGTYVYCVVASRRKPSLRGVPRGLPGAGPVRLLALPVESHGHSGPIDGRWLVVTDVPLERYGEDPINAGLSNLDWVSRAAIPHEGVVESFANAAALLPMKLFTIFASDERALAYVRSERRRIDSALRRVSNHEEWGVRLTLAGRRTSARHGEKRASRTPLSGAGYLAHKKAQRDVALELAQHAKDVAAELYDRLSDLSSVARRRPVAEAPSSGGALLLDAVFLVGRPRVRTFRKAVERQAGALKSAGYVVSMSGPWPPYSFMQD